MLDASVYEFPLNERIRIFMRLENSFAQIAHFSSGNNIWDSQASLLVLLDVLTTMERHDVRNELCKEIERNINILTNLLDVPGIETFTLQQTLAELTQRLQALQTNHSRLSKTLREDDLLSTIRQRTSTATGINSFEIPGYYYWLNQNDKVRQRQLDQWLDDSIPVADAISLLLDLVRSSADFTAHTAESGFFQTTLNSQQNCQMLRIALPNDSKVFPEASGNKHRISVRFMAYENTKQRPAQALEQLAFDLSCCGI